MKCREKFERAKTFIYLQLLLMFYSVGSVFSKLAGQETFGSIKFIFFYGIVICNLLLYALGWQQILKRMQLVTAYANKAVTVIWGLVWGKLIFKENISICNLIGTGIILAGIFYVVKSDAK